MEKIFTCENIQDVILKLKEGLNFPFVSVSVSTLGGNERISILLCIAENRENWKNGILENSLYRRFDIENNGNIENFTCQYNLQKMRKTRAKSIDDIINKINLKGQLKPIEKGV